MKNKIIKTRFAPSPTGLLHVGGLKTALYNYLLAKNYGGQFLLRIEDTDQSRLVPGATEDIKSTLQKFGLNWDGQVVFQSKRLKIYKQYAKQLAENDKAYYCFCKPEKLEKQRHAQQAKKQPTLHDCDCRQMNQEKTQIALQNNAPYVIRLKVPKTAGGVKFTDAIRGQVMFDYKTIDDQVLLKSDGFPTYHLANVVDDYEMKITHVIRGEEWLPSTPKHILLYQALDWELPTFAHVPLLLNQDKSKLSKRQGDVAVKDYLKKGYLPEALLNFVLLLGWNPGTEKEIFSLNEMIKEFDLKKINKAGAIFDTKKLDWLNGSYIRLLSVNQLTKLARPQFKQAGIRTFGKPLKKIVTTEQSRIKTLDEIVEATKFFFESPQYEPNLLLWKKLTSREVLNNLKKLEKKLAKTNKKDWQAKLLENEIKKYITTEQVGVGDMLWPMRVALSGRQASPGPFEIAEILGKKESLKRISYAISQLEKQ